ncbi:hypothetical protein Tco_0837981 [Tanacetum coccineum]
MPEQLSHDLLPIILRNLRIVSSGVKPSSRWLPVWEFAKRRPIPFAVRSSTRLSEEYDEERDMELRSVRIRETTPVLRTRVKRNSKGGRPSKLGSDGNRSQGMNLPPLLAAHLGRSENGQPLQSSLTSVYGGH